jgi:hypothetical protein
VKNRVPAVNDDEHLIEQIKKYESSSIGARLDWLEEANRLTYAVLSKREKEVRARIRNAG